MEAGDAEDAIPLTQPMFDGDATDDDPPAPRLVVTDDAETGATVPSHELPVPEVGDHRRTRAREAQRDRAAQRGNNAARNHVLRVAHRNMRQSRNQCRGISKTKRR